MIVATESGVRVPRRDSSSSSETCFPSSLSWSMMPSSKTQTRVTDGISTETSSNVRLFFSLSRNTATEPESLSIHWICSAEDVS